jgi:hypothetical protein
VCEHLSSSPEHFGLHQAFVKRLLLLVSLGKVYKGQLHLQKEISKLVNRGKWLKETRLEIDLVSNLSFLNEDVGITRLVIPNFGKQIIVSLLFNFRSTSCVCSIV